MVLPNAALIFASFIGRKPELPFVLLNEEIKIMKTLKLALLILCLTSTSAFVGCKQSSG